MKFTLSKEGLYKSDNKKSLTTWVRLFMSSVITNYLDFTLSTMALKVSGWCNAKSAKAFLLSSM